MQVRARHATLALGIGLLPLLQSCSTNATNPLPGAKGVIRVSGTHFLRDGVIWAPHGLNSVAFNAAPSVRTGLFGVAYNEFDASEVAAMKAWGNDTIRFFVSQAGLDKDDPDGAYDPQFITEFAAGVAEARAAGLNVIVCVQDEVGSGDTTPTPLPNPGTGNACQSLASTLKGDNGIMFEIMNEPELLANAEDWAERQAAMNNMIAIIRATGATNVVIADGLEYAEQLDNAPILTDRLRQVAYASHPYAHSKYDQTAKGNGQPGVGRDAKFGNVSVSSIAPVLVSEWSLENDVDAPAPKNTFQYCNSDSSQAALNMLSYLQGKGIGLLAIAYDLPNNPSVPRDGRATINEKATPSTLINTGCADPTFGPGTIIQSWYRTGIVPGALQ